MIFLNYNSFHLWRKWLTRLCVTQTCKFCVKLFTFGVTISPNKIVLGPYQPRAITTPPNPSPTPLSLFSFPSFPFFIHSSSFLFPSVQHFTLCTHIVRYFFFHFHDPTESRFYCEILHNRIMIMLFSMLLMHKILLYNMFFCTTEHSDSVVQQVHLHNRITFLLSIFSYNDVLIM